MRASTRIAADTREPSISLNLSKRSGVLQRKCSCGGSASPNGSCSACRKKQLQRKQSGLGKGDSPAVPAIVGEVLRSPGQPLAGQPRAKMASQFHHDFSGVRVHTDAMADASARAVNSHAFTVGNHVVFAAGRYAPETSAGRNLLAHELTHVVQQRSLKSSPSQLEIGKPDTSQEREAENAATVLAYGERLEPVSSSDRPVLQRDLARPPGGPGAPLVQLSAAEIQQAIDFNNNRFRDPYSIRVLRDVMGIDASTGVVDGAFVQAVVEWQAARNMRQDGQVGHFTTRTFYLELVAEGEMRDAIMLIMDSYNLPGDLRLHDVRIGAGAGCCSTPTAPVADAVTSGGPNCGGGPIEICFCRARIPRTTADYDHFVRITGHELIHVPQCAGGPANLDAFEFEAYFWEACHEGRAPRLTAAQRVGHANVALAHFAGIPAAMQTPARIAMRDQLNRLVAAAGVGPCV